MFYPDNVTAMLELSSAPALSFGQSVLADLSLVRVIVISPAFVVTRDYLVAIVEAIDHAPTESPNTRALRLELPTSRYGQAAGIAIISQLKVVRIEGVRHEQS